MLKMVTVMGAVEGLLDEAVIRRLVTASDAQMGTVYGKNGKHNLLSRLIAYNQAAQFSPWAILIDLDDDADCAPPMLGRWMPSPASRMCFRVAVREVEAWLLADRERLARYLSVPVGLVPYSPDTVHDPKRAMVSLARRSRSRSMREDMVPRPESGRQIGPAYTSRLIQFVEDTQAGWRPEVAAAVSDSLARCLRSLGRLIAAET